MRALFVSGSHADGRADEHSDLDLVAITHEDHLRPLATDVATLVDTVERVVDASTRPLGPSVLVNLITERCHRVDIVVTTAAPFTRGPRFGAVRALFDPEHLAADLQPAAAFSVVHDEAWFDALVRGVLRTVALLPMIVSRDELLRGAQHVQLLKQDLLALLLYAEGDPPLTRPGSWEWSDLPSRLPTASRDLVESLPPTEPSPEGVVRGHISVLDTFLVTARSVAASRDHPWPYDDFERAVRAHLERMRGTAPTN